MWGVSFEENLRLIAFFLFLIGMIALIIAAKKIYEFFDKLYTYYWREYRCRLEPWTFEWRRHVERWPWVPIVKLTVGAGLCLWALLFPLNDASNTTKIIVLVLGILVVAFYAWLLLHLGHYASRLWKKLRGK